MTEITCNIDRMCIRHHTHCSVESVAERGAAAPSLSLVRGRGRQVVETGASHAVVLADARPAALLAPASLTVVLADDRPTALLASAFYAVVLADA